MQEKKSKRDFDRSSSTAKNIRFEDELLEQINNAAGPGNFSSWVKEACREKLKRSRASQQYLNTIISYQNMAAIYAAIMSILKFKKPTESLRIRTAYNNLIILFYIICIKSINTSYIEKINNLLMWMSI